MGRASAGSGPRPTAHQADGRKVHGLRTRYGIERGHEMKQWLAILAAVALLTVPVVVSAKDETITPPEANWSATPGTPELVAVPQPRVASSAPEQAITSGAVQQSRSSFYLTADDARYQAVNEETME